MTLASFGRLMRPAKVQKLFDEHDKEFKVLACHQNPEISFPLYMCGMCMSNLAIYSNEYQMVLYPTRFLFQTVCVLNCCHYQTAEKCTFMCRDTSIYCSAVLVLWCLLTRMKLSIHVLCYTGMLIKNLIFLAESPDLSVMSNS